MRRTTAASPSADSAGAAVVIVLREVSHDLEALLIERAIHPLDRASGQVALPGGRVEGGDPDLRATAIRELNEEVGLSVTDLRVPPAYVRTAEARVFAMRVGVFATEISPEGGSPHPRSRAEVAQVFWLPRTALARTEPVTRATHLGPREVEASVFDGHVVWGFTRRILRDFFEMPDSDGRSSSPGGLSERRVSTSPEAGGLRRGRDLPHAAQRPAPSP